MNNKNEMVVKQENYLTELKNTQEMCKLLMQQPHYKAMGEVGVFAIVETAKSLGIDPRQALGGGLYFVRGKVEMSARMMNALIRAKKHSVTRDKRSNDTICILHGKRADNNDMWSESFSLDEAKKAGLYKTNGPWANFTRDMLFARALSRLARQLFPDIIGNCYVEGEVSLDPNIQGSSYQNDDKNDTQLIEKKDTRTEEEVKSLMDLFSVIPDYKQEVEVFLSKKDILEYKDIPQEMYTKVVTRAKEKIKDYMSDLQDKFSTEEMEVSHA